MDVPQYQSLEAYPAGSQKGVVYRCTMCGKVEINSKPKCQCDATITADISGHVKSVSRFGRVEKTPENV